MKHLNKRRKVCMLLVMILLLSTMSGCWDNKDINHRVLPVVLGITKFKDQYKVILKIPVPGQDETKLKIVSGTGKTIITATDNISRNMESTVDLLHVKLVIIDKSVAEEGLKDIISGFMRSHDVSPKVLISICDEDIETFFSNIQKTMSTAEGSALFEFFEKNAGWNPQIALTRLWEVYRSIFSYTHDVAIPLIISGESTVVELVGSAVIKNGKMVERIDPNETLLFNAFNKESAQGHIEVMNHASVLINKNSMRYHTKIIENQPYYNGKISLKVSVLETRGDPSSKLIKQELNDLLTARFSEMLSKLQKSEADILGIGQYFRMHIPRKNLKEWRSMYYPNLKMNMEFQIDIQNEGYLKTT